MDQGSQTISCLAVSLSGHDKGRIYVVVEEDLRGCMLADGVHHTLARPKKKNLRHVQLIRHLPQPLSKLLAEITCDSDIVHALRVWGRS